MNRLLWVSFALSTVLHLVLVYLVGELRQGEIEAEEFRVRLAYYREILKPRRLVTALVVAPDATATRMEYVPARGQPAEVDLEIDAGQLEAVTVAPVESTLRPGRLELQGAKSEAPLLARERMISPREMGLADSLIDMPMELLRWIDMARANREHAAVIPNLASPRDIEGFVNFTRIRVHGAGSDTAGSLDALARYMRDNSKILAQVRPGWQEYFLSEQLLKDPIHFLVESYGLRFSNPEVLTRFSEAEMALLRQYLDAGGFLFVEGSAAPPQRYLRDMIGHLRQLIGDEGGIFELPPEHPLYFSFFSFDLGFPGEDKRRVSDWGRNSWHYPETRMWRGDGGMDAAEPVPLGIYGINYRGDLVGVISDLNLAGRWVERAAGEPSVGRRPESVEPEPVVDHEGALQAATNIVAYALTRPGTMTPAYAPPSWRAARPAWAPGTGEGEGEAYPEGGDAGIEYEAAEIYTDLDAYVALLHSPLGLETADTELSVRIDGAYSLRLLRGGIHGLMLYNLPPGKHWLELSYGGKSKQLELELVGGQVTTATFSLNRFAFLIQLRLRQMTELAELADWLQSFGDLTLEEVFLGEDNEVLKERATP